jgi:DNA mismatch endonuclease (patch repair protein)
MAVRREVHSRSLRYRCDLRFKVGDLAVRPDLVFPRRRVAVFVDGCFWHACEIHSSRPAINVDYWSPKLQGNVDRDRRQDEALRVAGWIVVRAWEHDDPVSVADRVETAVLSRG